MKNRFHAGHLILFTGTLVLIFIFILLVVFMKKDVSMVTNDYYAQELEYDHTQKAMHEVIPLDSLFNIRLVSDSIELTIPNQINHLLTGCTIHLYCPANESYDKLFQLKPAAGNVYLFQRPWAQQAFILKIYMHAGEKEFYKEMKI